MNLVGNWIRIQAYKHDGEFHRMWSHCYVLEDNDDFIVLCSIKARVIENGGRIWHTKEPAIFICYKKEWFNIIAMIKTSGVHYYVNLASPSIYEDNFIRFIDYDLDVKLFPDGSKKLLDESEYRRHAKEYNYSNDIKNCLNNAVKIIYKKMDDKSFPFDAEKILEYYKKFLSANDYKKD
jgi:protein associated with RNAse G/E